uniref:Dpy-30-like protein n=1 Tax=Schistosoma japonicum TaxID=6182 RepID=C1LJ34_SCHJA|nr:Dpy-30-like protein [Schistosoma japonicum]CAX74711.1 Dpy-30-like protein [Schistosoma japonicum]CAX74712.1 Dpy-30-like protein [Schistosoma japonicum]
MESQEDANTHDVKNTDTRAYLDKTVVPVLLKGLNMIAKERPPNPIEALATFLMQHKEETENE